MAEERTVTLADVAAEAGVSVTTVSRVLNQTAGEGIRISDRTQRVVAETAERLGYRRNAIAAALRSKRSGAIVAVNRSMSGSYMSLLAHHLELAVESIGMDLFVARTRLDEEGLNTSLITLQEQLFDGFLLLGEHDGYRDIADRMTGLGKPVVVVTSEWKGAQPWVGTDHRAEMQLAVDHLLELGHKRLGFVGSLENRGVRKRFDAAVATADAHGLHIEERHIYRLDDLPYSPEEPDFMKQIHELSVKLGEQIADDASRPSALICGADGFAAGVLKGLVRAGVRVPEQISIIGADDSREAFLSNPELSTIRQPLEDIADAAVDMLRRAIDGEVVESRQIAPRLIPRESTAPAAGAPK